MEKVKKVTQLMVTTADKPGMLEEVTAVLAKENLNIEAISAYGDEGEAIFYLIVKDNPKARKALTAKGWEVKEDEVLVVDLENKAGALHLIASKFKKLNVNLRYCYGTTAETGPSHFVLKAIDTDLAVQALKG